MVKIHKTEVVHDSPSYKSSLGLNGGIATIMFAEGDFNQKPNKPRKIYNFEN